MTSMEKTGRRVRRSSKPGKTGRQSAYAAAGVDIDSKMSALAAMKKMINATATRGVVGGIGTFGGLFESPGAGKLLVASTDGVGTKLKVAALAGRHDTVGQDLVNHCVNDILVMGARPLFFMDYVGAAAFDHKIFRDVVAGLCKACLENNCALLGGETAEMPGMYPPGEYDLVGTIVGTIDRRKVITGEAIRPGDVIIGLPSHGLQTNGYSLARKVIFETAGLGVNDRLPGTSQTVADALLAVHRSFLGPITEVLRCAKIRGMAHITGGGFPDNIPRVLPADVMAVIDRRSWTVPPVFEFIREKGQVDRDEMYRVFNMGIGYVLMVRASEADKALAALSRARCEGVVMGCIKKGRRRVVLEG